MTQTSLVCKFTSENTDVHREHNEKLCFLSVSRDYFVGHCLQRDIHASWDVPTGISIYLSEKKRHKFPISCFPIFPDRLNCPGRITVEPSKKTRVSTIRAWIGSNGSWYLSATLVYGAYCSTKSTQRRGRGHLANSLKKRSFSLSCFQWFGLPQR